MSVYLRVDINIVALFILGLVFVIAYRRLDKQDLLNKMFLRLSLIIMLQLIFETATCIINNRTELWLIPVSNILHICLFATAPVLTYFWIILIEHILDGRKGIRKGDKLLLVPVVVNTVLTVLSPAYHFLFYISDLNVYHRGPLFPVASVITYSYFLYGFFLILLNKKKMVRQEFALFHIFAVLPIIGGVIQSLFYGVLLMWSSVAFSLVILYIFLQQRVTLLDDLTGAWSRSSFDSYITNSIRKNGSVKRGIIYIDIDGLKQINDAYGHLEGDFVIKTAIRIIRSVTRKSDLIVRMGGDEFVVILDSASEQVLRHTIDRIETNLANYNKKGEKDYRLSCSFGADVFDSTDTNIEQFLDHIDALMYQNKKMKKSRCEFE